MGTKLYEGVQNDLKHKIEKGIYPEGYKLPSENNLCDAYTVSKVTLRKALSNLIEEHYLESVPRVGYFVKTARRGVYHLSYSIANILTTPIFGDEILDTAFSYGQPANEFTLCRRYCNDDNEWVALERIRIFLKNRHSAHFKKSAKTQKENAIDYVDSILSLVEKKEMLLESVEADDFIYDALELFPDDVVLKISERYYDEYDRQFAEITVHIPSDYVMIQASNKKEES